MQKVEVVPILALMKTSATLLAVLLAWTATAQTNLLNLMWIQPVGYQSTIYSTTNINGQWQPLTNVSPPASLLCTQQSAFFIVMMQPTNQPACYSGYGAPTNSAMPGSTYVQLESGSFWERGTNAWIELIEY